MLAAERGAARNTILAYRRDLESAADALQPIALDDAVAGDIDRYLAGLAAAGFSPRTGARRLSALRQYFQFLLLEGVRGDDPTAAIDGPRLPRSLPKFLTEAEVEALLDAAQATSGRHGRRLLALVELLYATGLRVSELAALPVSALQAKGAMIVTGKGAKDRLVPLGRAAAEALQAYAPDRQAFAGGDPDSPWLFPSSGKDGRLSRRRIGQIWTIWRSGPASTPPASRRMCCAMRSRRISWRTAPTFARSRNYWATPISRRPKSIPTSWTSA